MFLDLISFYFVTYARMAHTARVGSRPIEYATWTVLKNPFPRGMHHTVRFHRDTDEIFPKIKEHLTTIKVQKKREKKTINDEAFPFTIVSTKNLEDKN